MTKEKGRIISGFTGINSGKIKNCVCKVQIKSKKDASGFCGMNSGEIASSYCQNKISANKNIVSFCKNTKGVKECFSVVDEKLNADAILDKSYIVIKDEIHTKTAKAGDWNEKTIWNQANDTPELVMKQYEKTIAIEEEQVKHISSEKELLDFARRVNEGLDEYSCAMVLLEQDLDMRGKRIPVIGKSELSPFCGVFNGNGHQIRNFVINEKKQEVAGLFGYVKDAVIENLHIDCVLHGGKYAGAIAGVSDNSKILGCHATAKSDARYCLGGFVGKNSGLIEGCSYVGKILKPLHVAPIAGVSGVASVAVVAMVVMYLFMGEKDENVRYPALPVSKDAVPIKGDTNEPDQGGNSILYAMNTKITAKTGKKPAKIFFKNPGKSNQNIVVELQITDKELKKKIGKTGRSEEELSKKSYDEKTSRVTIAKTGAIPPGYEQETIELSSLEDGTVLPKGTYQAVAYLSLYDIHTNQKAMVNAQTPVVLEIGG